MASTLVRIDIHLIFHVKSKGTMILQQDLSRVFAYIGGVIRNLDAIPIEVGGMPDHIHILTSLPKTRCLADFVRTVKAESSKWIKQINGHYYGGFSWQEGYGAFSISPNAVEKAVDYVRNQATHHQKKPLLMNTKCFCKRTGLNMMNDMHLVIDSAALSGLDVFFPL